MAEEKYQGVFPNADDCEKYLRNIHYELSERYQKGFELFQQKLFQMKKLHKISPLQFLPGIESETSTWKHHAEPLKNQQMFSRFCHSAWDTQ